MQASASPPCDALTTRIIPAVAEALAISKRFGATVALKDVTLAIRSGQSHALLGRNGAGKSTLVSIMTGLVAADDGSVRFDGFAAPSLSDRYGWRRNVACVYQRSTIIPSLTVTENLFLNRQSAGSIISWKALNRRAADLLNEYGVNVDVSRQAGEFDVETRQMIEIARALSVGVRFIVLDEPTAQLDGAAAARLFQRMRHLQNRGATFLFISHHLQEVFEVCESVTVLRDAQLIFTRSVSDTSRDQLIEAMTGETRGATASSSRIQSRLEQEPRLEVENLEVSGEFSAMNLVVRPGEIVGIAGSGSSGATSFGQSLFGLRTPSAGSIRVAGKTLKPGNVPASLLGGIGCVPRDRHKEGFVPLLGVGENITLSIIDRISRFGAIKSKQRREIGNALVDRLDIKTAGLEQSVAALSGGNQQKVVMGRALASDPKVLVLIHPTAGVDVRSKELLLEAIYEGAREGRAIVIITDDVDDLRCCDRVVVMFRGKAVREMPAGWAEAELVAAIEGIGIEHVA